MALSMLLVMRCIWLVMALLILTTEHVSRVMLALKFVQVC